MSESDQVEQFAWRIQRAVEDSVVGLLRKGDWIQPDYSTRVKLDLSILRSVYAAVDMERVKARVGEVIEQHIADKIFHSLATEIATDVKQILSNNELREDVRAILRAKIRETATALR